MTWRSVSPIIFWVSLAAMQRNIPMGRTGLPPDCVGAYLFLATDALSGFVTGHTLDVNGGQYLD